MSHISAQYVDGLELRIRELEAKLAEANASAKGWSDKAMEFSDLASKYEEQLAELRKGEPVMLDAAKEEE